MVNKKHYVGLVKQACLPYFHT